MTANNYYYKLPA